MALAVMFLSGMAGVVTSLTALILFNVSWSNALAIYLVTSIVPAALVMAGLYLHMQITRALTTPDGEARAHSPRV
ncbi:hypothetical protein [Marimonas lutisalis]|uniref:hypothetical protein n=1 Tax=Marimonas lutisalis TaxID=2545756 RepID=UPI0010F5EDD3|nr:hypothetical protein [Marimonas lutisalis]